MLCLARRKWVALEPEEGLAARLHCLNAELGYPLGCIAVEHRLQLNGMERRADIVTFTPGGTAHLLVGTSPQRALESEASAGGPLQQPGVPSLL